MSKHQVLDNETEYRSALLRQEGGPETIVKKGGEIQMTKLSIRISTAIATGAVLLNALALPVSAATTITVSGNGTGSDNNANVTQSNTTTVVQSNTANISNNVDVDQDTGNNSADDNTGGDVRLRSGDATSDVRIKNAANANFADVAGCGCQNGGATVKIEDNGSNSDNTVNLDKSNTTTLFQDNVASISNNVDVDQDTGYNSADDNTGGEVRLRSGDSSSIVMLDTKANLNHAKVGGGAGNGGGNVSAWITGNGTYSDNEINFDLSNVTLVTQDNVAKISNDVDVDADTGDNSTDDNTGGHVSLLSGDADSIVLVDNLVNFNHADVDCGCAMDLTGKIEGNGSHSDSDINFHADRAVLAFQANDAYLNNYLDEIDLDTGDNSADDNTAEVDGLSDPSLQSGDSDSDVRVNNSGNVNSLGNMSWHLPDMSSFQFSWDWGSVFGMFMHNS